MNNIKKLKFLFVTHEGLCVDLAWHVKKEGHDVKFFIQSKPDKDVGDGFVDKTENWLDSKNWADVIIFDDTGFGEIAEKLRNEGKLVIGGTVYTDKLAAAFIGGSSPSPSFKLDNYAGNCSGQGEFTSYAEVTGINTTSAQLICSGLPFGKDVDRFDVTSKIVIPSNAVVGTKTATLTFTAVTT